MNRHLDEMEIAAAVAGLELDDDRAAHLASCVSCRGAVRSMAELLEQRRRELETEAPDWQRQHTEIMARLPDEAPVPVAVHSRWRRPLLALAATVLLAVGVGSLQWRGERSSTVAHSDVAVEELLAEVDALLADESIPGLWPADPISDTDELESLFANGAS